MGVKYGRAMSTKYQCQTWKSFSQTGKTGANWHIR